MRIAFTLALLTLCIGLFMPVYLRAQQQDLTFERFTPEDVRTSDVASVIMQDHLGFLWMGTDGGTLTVESEDGERAAFVIIRPLATHAFSAQPCGYISFPS